MTTTGHNAAPRFQRVLVVEDDLTSREFLRVALEQRGWAVVAADGVPAAQQELLTLGFAAFDCVVTDYEMPELTGLDLLAWLQEWDACLATLILTAVGEKQLVADSLRGGAVDFLEKPVAIEKLLEAIQVASVRTRQQRHATEVQLSVRELGETQTRMLQAQAAGLPVGVEICFHPKLDAGGDFFSHFQPAPGQYCCLLTDVSGHDLQAAYLSAYFQGIVRGMLARAAPLAEVFGYFNRLLLEEWKGLTQSEAGTSVAVCALLVELQAQKVYVITCGTPAPVYVTPEGRVERLTEPGGFPLGWFEDFCVPARGRATAAGGAFLLWTDGLEDLAEKIGVTALSLGYALQRARQNHESPAVVAAAADDVLFAGVRLPDGGPEMVLWQPLVFEEYHGGQSDDIDGLQARWSRSVKRAVPEVGRRLLYDLLLAAREAVLNALNHGCQQDVRRRTAFQISYQPAQQAFRVWVDDPGAGHDFDLAAHESSAGQTGGERHRGLIMMKHLARRLRFERRGASVIMDFELVASGNEPAALVETAPVTIPMESPVRSFNNLKPTVRFEPEQQAMMIGILGDLTHTRVKALGEEILPELVVPAEETAPWNTVVLHLETATLVDSMGLNLIVKIYKAARLAGARVRVVCANPDVQRTLTFTRLDHQVELVRI